MPFAPQRVLIMGLGVHGGGVSSALFFARANAQVLVTDTKSKGELEPAMKKLQKYKNVLYVLGNHLASDFKKADLIIRNPAVPNDSRYLKIARSHNIPVHTDISYFLSLLPTTNYQLPTIIGITGTKGKSTTASLLHHVLTECGKSALLAGNIRKSPLDFLNSTTYNLQPTTYILLELSSWHLESLDEHKLAPQIALITNILPDHLNRYKNFNEYKKAKTYIFKHQKQKDIVFLNRNDTVSRTIKGVPSHVVWYPIGNDPFGNDTVPIIHKDSIAGVLAVAEYLRLNKKCVQRGIKTFKGLEGRLERITTIKGVAFYNDTCATQPDAAIFGIERIRHQESASSKIVLIAGGSDKNLAYAQLAKIIKKCCTYVIIYKGASTDTASDKIMRELQKISYKNVAIQTTLPKCVQAAVSHAKKGDSVLFSPAASSFGKFKHEFDRGEQFVKSLQILHKRKHR